MTITTPVVTVVEVGGYNMTNKSLHPRYPLNGTVNPDETIKTHLWNLKVMVAIRCDDEKGARHLFGRMAYLAQKRGIELGYIIDEVIDKGEVKDDYNENVHRKLEIMREKKSLRNEFGG